MNLRRRYHLALFAVTLACMPVIHRVQAADSPEYRSILQMAKKYCFECHNSDSDQTPLNLETLVWNFDDPIAFSHWERVFDKVASLQMPPAGYELPDNYRRDFLNLLGNTLTQRDREQVERDGRGTIRRLTRSEFQQNLRDLLQIPHLEVKDFLPEDRESHNTNRISATLDISRIQLAAYLEASDAALRYAIASGPTPRKSTTRRLEAPYMFASAGTFGGTEAMFFARNNQRVALNSTQLSELRDNPPVPTDFELAIFRSATWPYHGYPHQLVVSQEGFYRVRFSARAVLQTAGFKLAPATRPIAMTFRARKPSGPDVSGDVRATGGIMDVLPQQTEFETTIYLKPGETFEYSLLGLPQPRAINPPNAPLYYDFPPMPDGGHPGIAYQWLDFEGPLDSKQWPPASHNVLFGELPIKPATGGRLPIELVSDSPREDARRLMTDFIRSAQRLPLKDDEIRPFIALTLGQLDSGTPLAEALLTGYNAFLCSGHFLYTVDPTSVKPKSSVEYQHALAQQLSHFLTNSAPNSQLNSLANKRALLKQDHLHQQTESLIASAAFEQFLRPFTHHWLDLKEVWRDESDDRLYPEYRLNDYLIESLQREGYETFKLMVRDNLPITTLVQADFVLVNDVLAQHYGLPEQHGSALRKLRLPPESPYGGLLTTGALMKVTSNGTATSPIVRGAWVMEHLLGTPPPPPPADIPAAEPDIRGTTTLKEQLARHAADQSCAKCHAMFDPIGFSLENFDILGKWRTQYRSLDSGEEITGIDRAGHAFKYYEGLVIDSSATLASGTVLNGIQDLKQHLAAQPRKLARSLATQLVVYATGTPIRFSDRIEMENILDQCEPQGYLTRDIFHAVVQSRLFTGQSK